MVLPHVGFKCAGLHKTVVPVLACDILPENSRIKWLFSDVHVHVGRAGSHKMVVGVQYFKVFDFALWISQNDGCFSRVAVFVLV